MSVDMLLFFTFVLAIFLGFELISKVPSQLHTPLMSGLNAISGITIVGAIARIVTTHFPNGITRTASHANTVGLRKALFRRHPLRTSRPSPKEVS